MSTEDDKHLVAGGIGTYTGLLSQHLAKTYPNLDVSWYAKSPDRYFSEEDGSNLHRHYLSLLGEDGQRITNRDYRANLQERIQRQLGSIFSENPEARVVIEAPEWQGLLADLFEEIDDPRVVKISRIHTPLSVLLQLQDNPPDSLPGQVTREYKQMNHSNLLSSPTQYMLNATLDASPPGMRPDTKSIVIPNPINTADFSKETLSREEAVNVFREHTGCDIQTDNYNIFVIGRVEKRKGIGVITDAIPQIVETIPNAHIYFLGNHSQENQGTEQHPSPNDILDTLPANVRDHVHFTGYVDHGLLPNLMPAGDVFPICYLRDNFPGVLAEVGLSKRPIIAYLKGGVPEMVRAENGDYLVQTIPGEASVEEASDALAQGIEDIYRHPEQAQRKADALCGHLQKSYNTDTLVKQMLETYSGLFPDSHVKLTRAQKPEDNDFTAIRVTPDELMGKENILFVMSGFVNTWEDRNIIEAESRMMKDVFAEGFGDAGIFHIAYEKGAKKNWDEMVPVNQDENYTNPEAEEFVDSYLLPLIREGNSRITLLTYSYGTTFAEMTRRVLVERLTAEAMPDEQIAKTLQSIVMVSIASTSASNDYALSSEERPFDFSSVYFDSCNDKVSAKKNPAAKRHQALLLERTLSDDVVVTPLSNNRVQVNIPIDEEGAELPSWDKEKKSYEMEPHDPENGPPPHLLKYYLYDNDAAPATATALVRAVLRDAVTREERTPSDMLEKIWAMRETRPREPIQWTVHARTREYSKRDNSHSL